MLASIWSPLGVARCVGSCVFNASTFVHNYAISRAGVVGVHYVDVKLIGCTAIDNSSPAGGVAYVTSGSLTISSCNLTDNYATPGGDGGVVLMGTASELTVTSSFFENDTSPISGTIIWSIFVYYL